MTKEIVYFTLNKISESYSKSKTVQFLCFTLSKYYKYPDSLQSSFPNTSSKMRLRATLPFQEKELQITVSERKMSQNAYCRMLTYRLIRSKATNW